MFYPMNVLLIRNPWVLEQMQLDCANSNFELLW